MAVAWALLLLAAWSPGPARAETLAPGFDDQHVATIARPTALAFTPDGRLLVTGKLGALYVKDPDSSQVQVALDLTSVSCYDYERGLLGVAVDPEFEQNHYIYIYYTFMKHGTCDRDAPTDPVNRISRFVLSDTDTVDPNTETVLVDNIPSPDGIHNGGDLGFGSDGYLYASVGDGGCDFRGDSGCYLINDAARDLGGLPGKILRITASGGIPADNPFTGPDSDRCNLTGSTSTSRKCQEIYAYGLRNPFRFSFDPNTTDTRMFINDVGESTWEETDLGQAGADYGWPIREGPCAVNSTTDCGPPPAGMTNPIYWYDHDAGCTSITGSAVVPDGIWPRQFDGAYLYSDSVCGKILMIPPPLGGGTLAPAELVSGLGAPIDLAFGPSGSDQALYYLVFGNYPDDEVRKIVYTGDGNRTPRAVTTASPTDGALPLDVGFDGTQSSDPDGEPLTYDWDFGDGSPHGSGNQVSHTYSTAGTYTARLTVTDDGGASDSTTVRIDVGNHAPVPEILTPDSTQRFSVGEDLTLSGSATDAEDGTLPDSALSWEVVKHHATHTHPFLPPTTGNDVHITAPAPEDLSATTNTYLEIRLTSTDSAGRSTTVIRDVYPHLVNVSLNTTESIDIPVSGLQLNVAGTSVTTPTTVTGWNGWKMLIDAPAPQTDSAGKGLTFVSWSDGGAQTHAATLPGSDVTYTAAFTQNYVHPKGATPFRVPLVPAYRPCTTSNRTHGAPFAFGSCAPPEQVSDHATIGTYDANGFASRSVGFLQLTTITGDPSTPSDEADVRIRTSISDVLDPARGWDDYVGSLQAALDVRLTDRQSGSSGTDAATVADLPLDVTLPCTVTQSSDGSTCAITTTADTIAPGSVPEGQRSIWELGPVQLYDGGDDGSISTADNTLFATQGLFVP